MVDIDSPTGTGTSDDNSMFNIAGYFDPNDDDDDTTQPGGLRVVKVRTYLVFVFVADRQMEQALSQSQ